MTDHFEKAKDKILKDARTNGGVTSEHLLDAIGALAEDQDLQHGESMDAIKKNRTMVLEHFVEAKERDDRIAKLEATAEAGPELVKAYVCGYVASEHAERHGEHMDDFHSADADFRSRLVWFFASTFGKVVLVVFGILAGILLNILVYGRP